LAPGNYRLTLPRLAVTDRAGVALAADALAEFSAELDPLPPPPIEITSSVGYRAVRIAWTAPVWNGAPITDYVVQSRLEGQSWKTLADGVSTRTAATATNLQQGKLYHFRVASVNAQGTGRFSAETTAVAPTAVPDFVREITGTRGNGFVQLRWLTPVNHGDGPIINYRVQYSADNGLSWTTFERPASRVASAVVTGLTNGTAYLFRVAAINRVGIGLDTVMARSVTPATLPGAPTSVLATVTGQRIQLNWTAPAFDGGTPLVNYVVYYRNTRSSKWLPLNRPASTNTAATITLPRGASYVFRVAAVNSLGLGPTSSLSNTVIF
jgi:titin